MSEIRFRSDILVVPVPDGCCGSDRLIAHAAWVELPGAVSPDRDDTPAGWRRVIRSMMRDRHTSPFEQGRMTVCIDAPGVVWWQLTRQRFMSLGAEDLSPNVESGRYRVLEGVFYVPPDERPIREGDGFNPLRPRLQDGSPMDRDDVRTFSDSVYRSAWEAYSHMTGVGIAREVARLALPSWALYCRGYVGGGPLTWLQFFSKRNKTPDTTVPTFPQWEIEQAARACEVEFARLFPSTHAAFLEFGRTAP